MMTVDIVKRTKVKKIDLDKADVVKQEVCSSSSSVSQSNLLQKKSSIKVHTDQGCPWASRFCETTS